MAELAPLIRRRQLGAGSLRRVDYPLIGPQGRRMTHGNPHPPSAAVLIGLGLMGCDIAAIFLAGGYRAFGRRLV